MIYHIGNPPHVFSPAPLNAPPIVKSKVSFRPDLNSGYKKQVASRILPGKVVCKGLSNRLSKPQAVNLGSQAALCHAEERRGREAKIGSQEVASHCLPQTTVFSGIRKDRFYTCSFLAPGRLTGQFYRTLLSLPIS